MRVIRLALACSLLLSAAGCSVWQKPVAEDVVLTAPPEAERQPAPVRERREPQPLLLEVRAAVAALSYNIRGGLLRPPRVEGRLEARLQRGKWRHIVIHHSASDAGNEAIFDKAHKERRWRGVGYHFVIGNGHGSSDGLVEVTFRWEQQLSGAHAGVKEYNERGVGICLVGDFERKHPTAKQMEALVGLVNYLQDRCSIPTGNIMGHRHVKSTRCPGKNLPWYEFFSLLNH